MRSLSKIFRGNELRSLTRGSNFCFSEDKNEIEEKKGPSIYDSDVAKEYIRGNIRSFGLTKPSLLDCFYYLFRKFDWSTYVISNYLPSKIRDDFLAIHWFNIELMRIPESTKETALALGKLEFWNDSINQIFNDHPVKEPVSIRLHQACKANHLPKQLFQKLINFRKQEASTSNVIDISMFEQLSENIRTPLILLNLKMLRIDYAQYPELIEAAHLVGRALGMIDYIRRVPYNLRKYRLFMPEDILRKHSVSVRTLWERIEGKPKDELFDVILEVSAHARMSLIKSKELVDKFPPQAFRAFLHATEAEFFLEELEKNNFNVFSKNLNSNSYMILPYRVFKAAKSQKFLISL